MQAIGLTQECWRMKEPIGPLPSSKIYHSDERVNEFVKELKNRRKHPASRVNSFRLFSSDEVDYATISGFCESTADVHISIDTFGSYDPFNNPFWLLDAMYYKLQETGGYRSLTEDAIKQLEDKVGDDQQRFYQDKIMETLGDCSDSNVCISIDFPQRLESSFGDSLLEGIHNAILLFEHYSAMVVITAPGFRSQQWFSKRLDQLDKKRELQESLIGEIRDRTTLLHSKSKLSLQKPKMEIKKVDFGGIRGRLSQTAFAIDESIDPDEEKILSWDDDYDWKKEHPLDMQVLTSLTKDETVVVSIAQQRSFSLSDKQLLEKLNIKRPRLMQICSRLHNAGILDKRMVGQSRMFGLTRTALAQMMAWGLVEGDGALTSIETFLPEVDNANSLSGEGDKGSILSPDIEMETGNTYNSGDTNTMVEEGKLPPLIKNKEAIFSTPKELDNHSPGNFLLSGLIDKTGGDFFSLTNALNPVFSSIIKEDNPDKKYFFEPQIEVDGLSEKYDIVRSHLKTLSRSYPIQFSEHDLHMLGFYFWYERLKAAGLEEIIPGFPSNKSDVAIRMSDGRGRQILDSMSGVPEDQIDHSSMLLDIMSAYKENPLELILRQLKTSILYGNSDAESLALYYAVSLEEFSIQQDNVPFFQLLHAYGKLIIASAEWLTPEIELLKPNKIHPCFHMRTPRFGVEVLTRIAILQMALQDKNILADQRLDMFVKNRYLDREKFLLGALSSQTVLGTAETDSTWYKSLKKQYDFLHNQARKVGLFGSNSFDISPKNNESNFPEHTNFGIQNNLAVDSFNDDSSNITRLKIRQLVMRESILVPKSFDEFSKKDRREILGTYGDLGVPNPISPYDSSLDAPSNVLEAIERISHNNKNQGLRTHNRINGFLDMLWINQHRRESYGNRFIGLNLLDEFTELSSKGFEQDCAKKMLFHSQKVIRLLDKSGSSKKNQKATKFSRTNKFSRFNLYSRLLSQFQIYYEDESKDIDRMTRPGKNSLLRNLLQPIRLQTGKDLDIEDLPYGLVTQIMSSRMDILVSSLSSLISMYATKDLFSQKGNLDTSPMLRDAAFLRTFASLVAMEVCQLHMISVHLPIKSKSSKFLHIQTRNTVEHYDELQGQKMDLEACTIDGEILKAEEIIWEEDSSILEHLKTNKLPTARDLIHRLSPLCLPLQNESEILSTTEREQIVRFVGSLLQFCDDESPTGQKYVEIARKFDQIYVDHMPTFMSPDVLSRGMFEYF